MEKTFVSRLRKVVTHKYKEKKYYTYIFTVPIELAEELEAGRTYTIIVKDCAGEGGAS